jgi:hypothetical protein
MHAYFQNFWVIDIPALMMTVFVTISVQCFYAPIEVVIVLVVVMVVLVALAAAVKFNSTMHYLVIWRSSYFST